MIAYVLSAKYITVLWSMTTLTSIHFEERVKCTIAHGQEASGNKIVAIKYERGEKTVSIFPLVEGLNTNFNCYGLNSEKMYFFNVRYSKSHAQKNIKIKNGNFLRGGKKVWSKGGISIFDTGKNYWIKNKTGESINVNDERIKSEGVVSRWLPLEIDGDLIFF
jgi:hypothetical protein